MIILAALSRLGDSYFQAAEKIARTWAERKRWVVAATGLLAVVARLALLPVFPVPTPAVHDEFSYLLAADTFVHGRLANPPHPMALFLDTFHVLQEPTYSSIFPPAQGAFLAIGQTLHLPWLGVLLSVGIMCAAVVWMLQGWFPPVWAMLGGILVVLRFALFSYWVNTYWGGAVAAIGGALVLGAYRRIIHHHRTRDAVILGFGASILANSRPLEGFIFCVPVMVALTAWLFSKTNQTSALARRRMILSFLSVIALLLAFSGYYNWRVTGNILQFPHALYMKQQCNCRVFAWQKPFPPIHYTNAQFEEFYNVRVRDRYAPTWRGWKRRARIGIHASWSLLLGTTLSIAFASLPWTLRDRRVRLLIIQLCCSGIGLLSALYFLPHYVAPLTATVFALVVQSMRHLRKWTIFGKPVGVVATRAIVLAAIANVPVYVWSTLKQPPEPEYWSEKRIQLTQQLEATSAKHLVLVHYSDDHVLDDEWVYNSADIDSSKIVWAREIPGQDPQPLLQYFRGRELWLLDADARPIRLRHVTPEVIPR